jgi:methionyl-tRNA synthetase
MKKTFYITTPIYYPSANFHIGHCYSTIIADSIARYKRLDGYDTYFLTGSDEHGQKIEKKALEAGVTPKEYVDKIVENAKDLWASLGITYDRFIRTTDQDHVEIVQKIFKKLYDQGDIYKGEYKGLYCTPCESFWTETQAVDGKCPDCGRDIQEVKEEAYFLKLSKYQARLEKYIEEHPEFIEPESRKNEMINNFLKPGLEDLCVSRTSFTWGIPVTFDTKHVVYVWLDALSNYITALGYGTDHDELMKKYWPADVHIVGKEIVRFHTIIWPIILMALDLPLPKKVFGHGWLIIDGSKISKSLGNYKDPREYIESYGVDAVRYFSLREIPFGNDGNFSEDALVARINSDLANVWGNLVSRTIGMANKYFDGTVTNKKVTEELDKPFIKSIDELKKHTDEKIDELQISKVLEEIFDVLRASNKYIDDTAPWVLAKDDTKKDRLETILYNLLEAIRVTNILLMPFMPESTEKVKSYLGNEKVTFEDAKFIEDNVYNVVENPQALFQRIQKENK